MVFYVMYSPFSSVAITNSEPDNFKNASGNHECVEFVRQSTGAPSTRNWRPGLKVRGDQSIPLGAAIATFKEKKFSKHAAIYLSQDELGIVVLDQWNAKAKVTKRRIKFPDKYPKLELTEQNNGDMYFVIDTQDTENEAAKNKEANMGRII